MPQRRAFTMIELLVVLAVIGLLVSLLLPAVQYARESARKAQCASNLKQIGIGLHGYEATYGFFPNGTVWKVSLCPYIGETGIAKLVGLPSPDGDPHFRHTRIPLYLCPSDPAPDQFPHIGSPFPAPMGAANYVGCFGSSALCCGLNGMFNQWGMTTQDYYPTGPVRFADVVDGVSATAFVSEQLHGDRTLSRLRTKWMTPSAFSPPNETDALADLCESLPTDPVSLGWLGDPQRHVFWSDPNYGGGLYNHALPPNRPSCNNQHNHATGAHTAGSFHGHGVQLLYVDGRVQFESASIDRQVWREIGSRIDRVVGPSFP